MPSAMISASIMPCWPPSIEPIAMNSAVIAAIKMAVFIRLNIDGSPGCGGTLQMRTAPDSSMLAVRIEHHARRDRLVALQERRSGEALAAGALQFRQAQRAIAAGHRDAVVVHREHFARHAGATGDHRGAPALDRLAGQHP